VLGHNACQAFDTGCIVYEHFVFDTAGVHDRRVTTRTAGVGEGHEKMAIEEDREK
jgi:hypothetical protein